MAKIISICNQKGGVGKTTTAINLSVYLALDGKKTLLIDIDPQGNATSGVGLDKHNVEKSVYHLLVDSADPKTVIVKSGIDNLSLIPSNLSLTGAEVELVAVMGREYRLKKALTAIAHEYEYIIIDCPPSLGLLTINALAASNSIIIPVQCEYYALEGLSQLVNTITMIRENVNQALDIQGVLLTMADFRTKLTDEVIAEARNYFKEKVFETVIPRNIKLTEAPGFGKPIVIYDKNSIGAQKYKEFSDEILKVKKETIVENKKTDNTLKDKELQENVKN